MSPGAPSLSGIVEARGVGEVAGLAVAGVALAFTVTSALNGTPASAAQIAAASDRGRELAERSLSASTALAGASALALLFLYGHRSAAPAIVTGLAGAGLYAGYRAALHTEASTNAATREVAVA